MTHGLEQALGELGYFSMNKHSDPSNKSRRFLAMAEQTTLLRSSGSRKRCHWCNLNNPLYVDYHDREWGVPLHDDRRLFEMLILEGFQAGLSWECILNKREAFRKAFDDFDYDKVAGYDETKLEALRTDEGIVRNRLKVAAAVVNAKAFMAIQKEFGSFDRYIWSFTDGKTIYEWDKTSSPLSDRISKDMKRRGMKFVGTTIIYSYLQAIGIINSHEPGCGLYKAERYKNIMKIDHVALYCRDLEGMKDFFEKYFQAKSNDMYYNPRTNLRTYILTFPDGQSRLEIMTRPEVEGDNDSPYHVGFIHLSFSVGSKEAVDELTTELRAGGYETLSGPRTTGDGYYESCVKGFEGTLIEITV